MVRGLQCPFKMPATALIVDDETSLRRTLAEILRARGYSILEADDGGRQSNYSAQPSRISSSAIGRCQE